MSIKHITFVHHRYGYGGASKALRFYVNSLVERGVNVRVVFYDSDGSEQGNFAPEIDVIALRSQEKNRLLRRVVQIWSSYRAVKEFRSDTVIGLMPVNAMLAVIIGRMAGARVIGSERGNPYSHIGIAEKVKRFFLARADGVIFQTEGARDFYGERVAAKSVIIPNSVEPSLAQIPFEKKQNQCTFFARFDLSNKRFDLLFDAFSLVRQENPDMVLNIFGSGSAEEEQEVKRLCSDRDLLDRVVFHGAVKSTYDFMEKYKYFLLTSDSEGMPNALMEAMACGMVCITTDCEPGGARYLVQDRNNGRLVERGNEIDFSESLIECFNEQQNAKRMSENARLISRTLSKQNIANKFVSFILSE